MHSDQPREGGSIPTSPLRLTPIRQRQAKKIIAKYHRHNIPSVGSIFNIGLKCGEKLVGVAMVGLPKARLLMDGETLEVTRVCIIDGIKNANSMLYGACARAAQALGYSQIITYTLVSESGASLKAAGWKRDDGEFGDGDWTRQRSTKSRTDMFGMERIPDGPKLRWRKIFADHK